ncbi:MAG: hypothetical protein WCF03_03165 [Nitrososphaeraceae archaeon]
MRDNKQINIGTWLRCQRCSHEWKYSGHNPYFTLCPHCRTTVRIKSKIESSLKPVEVGDQMQAPMTTSATSTLKEDNH